MGRDIISDFGFHNLPLVNTPVSPTTVLLTRDAFPAPGLLVRESIDPTTGVANIRVFEAGSGIQYWAKGIGCFLVESSGRHVWYCPAEGARLADVEHMLAGPVLGLAFQLQEQILLHASAVLVDGLAVAFSAPHGTGKSTLAASFVRAGYALVTDDVLPITEDQSGFRALHSLPRMKLWQDSLVALGEDPGSYDVVLRWLDKRRVTVGERWGDIAPDQAPLAVLYLLAPHLEPEREIEFSDLEPLTAAFQVIGNMYMADMLRGERAARALDLATRIVSAIRIRRVSYYREYTELPRLRAAILTDVRREGCAA